MITSSLCPSFSELFTVIITFCRHCLHHS